MNFAAVLIILATLFSQSSVQAETQSGAPSQGAASCDSSGDGAYNWQCLDPFKPGGGIVEIPRETGFLAKLVYSGNSSENKFASYAKDGRIYPFGLNGEKIFLHRACLPQFDGAKKRAVERGCQLVIYDAVRPCSVQRFMYDIAKNKMNLPNPGIFVANPAGCAKDHAPEDANKVSMHNRGLAVDVSLDCDNQGKAHDPKQVMGGEFDDFQNGSAKYDLPLCSGASGGPCLSQEQKRRRALLRSIMVGPDPQTGFKPYEGEWWHFNCLPFAAAT